MLVILNFYANIQNQGHNLRLDKLFAFGVLTPLSFDT